MKKKWIKDGIFWNGSYVDIGEKRIYNPTEEQLIEAGYVEYVTPEPSDEDKLRRAKEAKVQDAVDYYHSSVCGFTLNGNKIWGNSMQRACFKKTLDEYIADDHAVMPYTYNKVLYRFTTEIWLYMFNAVEVYANEIKNIIEGHKSAIEQLLTIEEVSQYDYTVGYPAKLVFDYTQDPLSLAKTEKLRQIEEYDSSDSVNGFTVQLMSGETVVQEIETWIDRETRADYKNSLDAAELLGRTEVTPVFNGVPLTLPVSMAKMALAQIQIYANQCFNVTSRHKAAVQALSTIQEVEAFDITADYPQKLQFTVPNTSE